MIPAFDQHGYLPPGVHGARLAELLERFGERSELRRDQADSLQWLIPLCKPAGIARVIINGRFVTNVSEPSDVDCVLLMGPAYNEESEAAAELERGLPFLSIEIIRESQIRRAIRVLCDGSRWHKQGRGGDHSMTLRNDLELANTEQKLAKLQDMITRAQNQPGPGRNVEVRSLTRLANELREEIARYKASTRRAAPRR